MYRIRQEDLPFAGSSHQFVGADRGDTGVSVFLFNGRPGAGPGPHRHPYDEVQFVREGRGLWKVNGVEFEGRAGDVFVIKAGPEYQELAKNTVGEILMATPAISDGLIIFRGHKHVIAIKAP